MKKIIHTASAPQPIGPYSQAVQAGNMLFVSGQIAIDPATGELLTSNLETETTQVMENLRAVLMEAGYDLNHVVKTSIFLSSMSHFQAVNEVYGKYFHDNFPARETVAAAGLPKNVNVEISVVAVKF